VPAEYWSGAPVWSRDGSMLAYSIAADSPPNIVLRDNRGAGAERRLTKSAAIQYPAAFTPDAQTLLYRAFSSDTGWDLFTVPVDGSSSPQRLLQTPANETEMSLSPDGRFLAYTSDDSGRTEVYVSRFPEMSGRMPVSTGGGQRPSWRADGRELYFVGSGNRLMAATVTITGATPAVGSPSALFEVPVFGGLYAPSGDGRRFLIAMPAAAVFRRVQGARSANRNDGNDLDEAAPMHAFDAKTPTARSRSEAHDGVATSSWLEAPSGCRQNSFVARGSITWNCA